MDDLVPLIVIAVLAVAFVLILVNIWGLCLKMVPPNKALIKYGRGGVSVVTGGVAFIWPLFQRADSLSLEVMAFEFAGVPCVTADETAVVVRATALLRVRSERESILAAARQLLSRSADERRALLQPVLEQHLGAAVGQVTSLQLVSAPALVNEQMRRSSQDDLTSLGLEIVAFTLKEAHATKGGENARSSGPLSLEILHVDVETER